MGCCERRSDRQGLDRQLGTVTKHLSPSFVRNGLETATFWNAAMTKTEEKQNSPAKELNLGYHHSN